MLLFPELEQQKRFIFKEMKNILLPEDSKYLEEIVKELKAESKILTKKLGVAAAHGGAVPFQIPEYQAIDDRLRSIKERVEAIQEALSEADIIPFEKLDDKKISFYSLVTVKNLENENEEKYYLIHPELIEKIELSNNIFPVSPKSPVGKSLLGKKSGIVEINLGLLNKPLEIISFEKKRF